MFKLRVPFQLSEVQFNVDLTDCAVRRPSGPCKELTRAGGPALLVPLWPVLQSPSQAGTAGLGQRRLLCYHQAACAPFLLTLWFLSSSQSSEGEGSGGFGLCRRAEPPPNALRGGEGV